jgi:hypothetical protein
LCSRKAITEQKSKKLAYQLVIGNRTIITCHEVISLEETKFPPNR